MALVKVAFLAVAVLCCWHQSHGDNGDIIQRSLFLPCATSCFGKYELCISPNKLSENDQIRCIHNRNGCEKVCIARLMKKKKFKRGENGCHIECNDMKNKCLGLRSTQEFSLWRRMFLCNLYGSQCKRDC